jgi:HEAT repeat protein
MAQHTVDWPAMLERTGRAILISAAAVISWPAMAATIPSRLSADEFNLLAERLHQSGSYKVRIQAALLLGAAGGSEALPLLVTVLKDDPRASVRAAAALGLGAVRDDRAYPPLVESLGEPDAFVRAQIGKALVELSMGSAGGLRLWAALQGAPNGTRLMGVHLLASLGADGVPALLVASNDPSSEVSGAVKDELLRLPGAQLRNGLVLALGLRDARMSALAAIMLADALDFDAIPQLADAVVDPRQPPTVSLAARTALKRLSEAIDLRVETRRAESTDANERSRALVLIAAKGGDEAQDLLVAALDDDDPLVLAQAVNGLAEVGDTDALPSLRALEGKPPPIDELVRDAVRRIERSHLSRSDLLK